MPTEIARADFDRDGVMDLVVTDQGFDSATVVLHPGLEGGGELVELPVEGRQTAVDTGDLDGDGSADVVVASGEGLSVFFGDGTGGFPRTQSVEGTHERGGCVSVTSTGTGRRSSPSRSREVEWWSSRA